MSSTGHWQKSGRKRRKADASRRQARARTQEVDLFRGNASNAELGRMNWNSAMAGATSLSEVKSFDVQVNAGGAVLLSPAASAFNEPTVAFAGITELNCVLQDASSSGRVGSKIVMKSISLRCQITANTVTSIGAYRLVLLYDRQTSGHYPVYNECFMDLPQTSYDGFSSTNMTNRSRFIILRDHYGVLDAGTGLMKVEKMYVKGRWEVEFGTQGGTIADIRSGSVLVLLTLAGPVSGALNVNNIKSRIRYYD